jgi:hypothetical protein
MNFMTFYLLNNFVRVNDIKLNNFVMAIGICVNSICTDIPLVVPR